VPHVRPEINSMPKIACGANVGRTPEGVAGAPRPRREIDWMLKIACGANVGQTPESSSVAAMLNSRDMGSPFSRICGRRLCGGLSFVVLLVAPVVFAQTAPANTVQPLAPATVSTLETAAPGPDTKAPLPPSANQASRDRTMRIGAGDLLEIKVFGVPDMAQDARVNDAGEIAMPLIGAIAVSGSTALEAQRLIESHLREGGFLRDPQVSVFIKEYASQGISVLGEVQRPGIYSLLGNRRLYDAISAAGGTTARAGRAVTITHRDAPDQPIVLQMDSDPTKSAAGNVDIFPADTVMVSRAGVVYVVGDVARPAGFVMDNNEHMTVLQALAMAGGANFSASLQRAKVIRKTPNGVQEIPMPLNKILAAQAEDVPLHADDVLFVPNSKIKSAGRRSAEAVLAIATGVAIYRR
jgi:polysaccharide export outer membrane protein